MFQKRGEASKAIRTLQGVREGIKVFAGDSPEAVAAKASFDEATAAAAAATSAGSAAPVAPAGMPSPAAVPAGLTPLQAAKQAAAAMAANLTSNKTVNGAPLSTATSSDASASSADTDSTTSASNDTNAPSTAENAPVSPLSKFVVFYGLFADPQPVLPAPSSSTNGNDAATAAANNPSVAKPSDWVERLQVFGDVKGSALDASTGTLAVEFDEETSAASCLEILHGRESFGKIIVGDFASSGIRFPPVPTVSPETVLLDVFAPVRAALVRAPPEVAATIPDAAAKDERANAANKRFLDQLEVDFYHQAKSCVAGAVIDVQAGASNDVVLIVES